MAYIDAILENPIFKDHINSKQLYLLGQLHSKYALWIAKDPQLSCQVSYVTVLGWARNMRNDELIHAAMSQPHLISGMHVDDLIYFAEQYRFQDNLESLAIGLIACFSSMPEYRKNFWLNLTFQNALFRCQSLYVFYREHPNHFISLIYQHKLTKFSTDLLFDFFRDSTSLQQIDHKSLLSLYTDVKALRRTIIMLPTFCTEMERIAYVKNDHHFTANDLVFFAERALSKSPYQVDFADFCLKTRICKERELPADPLLGVIVIRAYQNKAQQALHWLSIALPILSKSERDKITELLSQFFGPNHKEWNNYQAILNKTDKDSSSDDEDLVTRLHSLDLAGNSNTQTAILTHYKEKNKPQHNRSKSEGAVPNSKWSRYPI